MAAPIQQSHLGLPATVPSRFPATVAKAEQGGDGMRVGLFFLACMMTGAVAGIVYAANTVHTAWRAAAEADLAHAELEAYREVFRVPEMLQAERITSVGQMTAAAAAGPAEQTAMATARAATDTAFDHRRRRNTRCNPRPHAARRPGEDHGHAQGDRPADRHAPARTSSGCDGTHPRTGPADL